MIDTIIRNKMFVDSIVLSRDDLGWRSIHRELQTPPCLVQTTELFDFNVEYIYATRIPSLEYKYSEYDYAYEYENDYASENPFDDGYY